MEGVQVQVLVHEIHAVLMSASCPRRRTVWDARPDSRLPTSTIRTHTSTTKITTTTKGDSKSLLDSTSKMISSFFVRIITVSLVLSNKIMLRQSIGTIGVVILLSLDRMIIPSDAFRTSSVLLSKSSLSSISRNPIAICHAVPPDGKTICFSHENWKRRNHHNNQKSFGSFVSQRMITTTTSTSLSMSIWSGGDKKSKKGRNDDEIKKLPPSSSSNDDTATPPPRQPEKTSSRSIVTDPVLLETSKILQRVSFLSWWSQVILTTISAIILLFARSVGSAAAASRMIRWYSPRFFLSGTGLVVSTLSILWTWGNGNRLSQRLINPTKVPSITNTKAARMIRKAIYVGICLNLVGLLFYLVAAEEIVGTLAMKVLTMSPYGAPGNMATMFAAVDNTLQPIDILVVQANTNALLSHYISLTCNLYLSRFVSKLDPSVSSSSTTE